MIKRLIVLIGWVALLMAGAAMALEGNAGLFPDAIEVESTRLVRRGVGRMRRWMITGADVALYTEPGLTHTQLLEDVPKAIVFHYYVSIRAHQFRNSGLAILRENSSADLLAANETELNALGVSLQDVGRGDRYVLSYVPERGTALSLNGEELVVVPGASFAALYFRIWLGDPPIDPRMYGTLIEAMRYDAR